MSMHTEIDNEITPMRILIAWQRRILILCDIILENHSKINDAMLPFSFYTVTFRNTNYVFDSSTNNETPIKIIN